MQVIDLTPLKPEIKKNALKRWQLILKYGTRWYQDQKAQDRVIEILRPILDSHYLLIRGLKLEGQEAPLPPLLIGPQGAYLLAVWHKAGFYRIREGYWEVMQRNSRNYRLAKPNVVKAVKEQAAAAEKFLESILRTRVPVTPLLVFTNPAADVDTLQPAVRPLLIDGLKRYALKMEKSKEAVLTPNQVLDVYEAVIKRSRPAPKRPAPKSRPAPRRPNALDKVARYFNFTPQQWAILGILAVLTLCVMLGVIIYVYTTAI